MVSYIGQLRKKIGSALIVMPSAAVVIFDEERRVLLARHSDAQQWVLPGGSLEPHESPADAALREAWEETGVQVILGRLIGVYGGPDLHITYQNGDEVSYVMSVFEAQISAGLLRPDGDEILELAYFSPAELASLDLQPWLRTVLRDAFAPAEGSCFQAPSWRPPTDGVRKGGMSDYIRMAREKVGHDMLVMSAAGGVVFDEQGNVLMQQRSDNGRWAVPAGAIEPDETPADAVVREIWEETGVLVEPVALTGIYGGPEFYNTYPNGDLCAVFSVMFACRVIGGELLSDGLETLAVGYVSPEQLTRDYLPKRWWRRIGDALQPRRTPHVDPPTWRAPDVE